jgi:hypothetical protein
MVIGLLYTMMMKGFCNVALYRLEQEVMKNESEEAGQSPEEDAQADLIDSISSSPAVSSADGEIPKLQWAARLQTGYEGNLTADQEKALNMLREDLMKNHPEDWKLCSAHPDGLDRIMLRFLRAECSGKARKFHIEKSKPRLIETLRFRQAM